MSEPPIKWDELPRRYEMCRWCGKSWNVSRQLVIPPTGYLCPRCRGVLRSNAGTNRKKGV